LLARVVWEQGRPAQILLALPNESTPGPAGPLFGSALPGANLRSSAADFAVLVRVCGNPPTRGGSFATNAFMRATTFTRPVSRGLSRFGPRAWRLAAGLLYAFSLVLVPLDLPAAVAALLASVLCFPETRSSLFKHTGFRLGGLATASLAAALVLGAVMSTGWQAGPTDAGAASDAPAKESAAVTPDPMVPTRP